MNIKKLLSVTSGLALLASMALAIPAFAETNSVTPSNLTQKQGNEQGWNRTGMMNGTNRGPGMMKPGVSGKVTAVVATSIYDGVMTGRGGWGITGQGDDGKTKPHTATSTMVIGNGQPVIAGTISAITGSTLTITTASNVTYTVNASGSKILQGQNSVNLSSLTVGKKVIIQGMINGTSVTASTIFDQVMPTTGAPGTNRNESRGFFASIG